MRALVPLWRRKGLKALSANDYPRAEHYLRKVFDVSPNNVGSCYNLAVALMTLKKFTEAEDLFFSEIKNQGESFLSLRGLGDLYYISHEPAKAIDVYCKAEKLCQFEEEKLLLYKRVENCQSMDSYRHVVSAFEFFETAQIGVKNKKFDEALRCYILSVEHDDTIVAAWNSIGSIQYAVNNDIVAALHAYEKAKKYSSSDNIQQSIIYLKRLQS